MRYMLYKYKIIIIKQNYINYSRIILIHSDIFNHYIHGYTKITLQIDGSDVIVEIDETRIEQETRRTRKKDIIKEE